jgi:hypothetical protein
MYTFDGRGRPLFTTSIGLFLPSDTSLLTVTHPTTVARSAALGNSIGGQHPDTVFFSFFFLSFLVRQR